MSDREMLDGKVVIGVIPARGGSKRTPRKNIKEFRGKTLLQWAVECARGSRILDELVVSTEDVAIAEVARTLGVEVVKRPAELATDDATNEDVLRHVLGQRKGCGWVVLLQPTSPLRSWKDVDGCLRLCFLSASNACVTYKEDARHEHVYEKNGAVYVARAEWLAAGHDFTDPHEMYIMPRERSLDIDYPEQFE